MNADMSFNWFDLIALAVLAVGVVVGRKRGMSAEVLPVVQWLMIVFGAAAACGPFGTVLADVSGLGPVYSFVIAYLLAAVVIKGIFLMIQRAVGQKLVGSDVFGNLEYYLGMAGGFVRFACILIFCLALLSARQVSQAELDRKLRLQREDLGNVYIPPFGSIQRDVFEGSLTGRTVKQFLSAQLINVDPRAGTGVDRENIGERRLREVEQITKPQ